MRGRLPWRRSDRESWPRLRRGARLRRDDGRRRRIRGSDSGRRRDRLQLRRELGSPRPEKLPEGRRRSSGRGRRWRRRRGDEPGNFIGSRLWRSCRDLNESPKPR